MDPREHVQRLLTAVVCAGDGLPIGPVTSVYVDIDTGVPLWVGVTLHPTPVAEHLVPLIQSWLYPGPRLIVAVSHRVVEEAPVASGSDMTEDERAALHRFYTFATNVAGPLGWKRRESARGLRRITLRDFNTYPTPDIHPQMMPEPSCVADSANEA